MKLSEVAAALGLELRSTDGADTEISGLGSLHDAGVGQLTYIAEAKHAQGLATTGASAAICRPEHASDATIP
jgi:UDP-3-O-[3-hydroxymyristoyl] glucosamine N-acyltransferase